MKRLVYSYLSNVNIENTNWQDLIIELVSVFNLPKSHIKYLTRNYLIETIGYDEANKFIRARIVHLQYSVQDVVLPVVRRIVSRTIASELVSVQPMEMPNVQSLYFNYVYKETKLTFKQKIIARIKKLFYLCKKYCYVKKI